MKKVSVAAIALMALVACGEVDNKTSDKDSLSSTNLPKDSLSTAAAPADSAAVMQACMNFMQTGPMHQMLAKDNGAWTDDITMWMAPGAPPSKMTSSASVSMILGGRYQQTKHTGSMDGMPFEGISTTGYDNARKKFINTWIDNMGTGIIYLEGDYDSTAKTIHFVGKQTDPVSAKQVDIKQNVTFNPDGTQTMTMYAPPMGGGAEYKMMEIVTKRK